MSIENPILGRLMRVYSLILLVLLTSCAVIRQEPVTGTFDGIKHALNDENVVSVLFTHGMQGYANDDPATLIHGIADGLGLEKAEDEDCVRILEKGEPPRYYGFVSRETYRSVVENYKVRFYILDWRPTTWDRKANLRALNEETRPQMGSINYRMKAEIVDNGLSDVGLYVGHYDGEIQYPFEQALRWIHKDSREDSKHEIIFISFSLGSQIMLDALAGMDVSAGAGVDVESQKVRRAFIEEVRAFFMLSNQLPLVHMTRLHPLNPNRAFDDLQQCDPDMTCDHLQELCEPESLMDWQWDDSTLGRFIRSKRRFDPGFKVIAFSDPNDVFSYAVPAAPKGDASQAYVWNVPIRNAKWNFFGFVNPAAAHRKYGTNPLVIDLIVNGHSDE